MAKFKIKAGKIDAFKWTGDWDQKEDPSWIVKAMKKPGGEIGAARIMAGMMKIVGKTRLLTAYSGDYLILAPDGSIYPCSAEVFKLLHEEA